MVHKIPLMTSNYLADAYETYSSSAQAAQSLARNVMSAIFPLFAYQLVSLFRITNLNSEPFIDDSTPGWDIQKRRLWSLPSHCFWE